MIYLLDVNALIALGFAKHEFHARVAAWLQTQKLARMASCSTTELGFVRVLAQVPAYGLSVLQAKTLLLRLKEASKIQFTFIPDAHDISRLPNWVRWPKQITDGHLVRLAVGSGAILATLDEAITGSYLIPK